MAGATINIIISYTRIPISGFIYRPKAGMGQPKRGVGFYP